MHHIFLSSPFVFFVLLHLSPFEVPACVHWGLSRRKDHSWRPSSSANRVLSNIPTVIRACITFLIVIYPFPRFYRGGVD